jgi:hypothetical protein
LRARVSGKREHEIAFRTPAVLWKIGEPAESDADIDGAEDSGAIDAELVGDPVIAGIASPIIMAVQTKPHQREPMDDADSAVVGDAPQPIEGLKFWGCLLGIHHG